MYRSTTFTHFVQGVLYIMLLKTSLFLSSTQINNLVLFSTYGRHLEDLQFTIELFTDRILSLSSL